MGKSRVVRVVVSPKSAELTIGLSRADGVPGVIRVYGSLFEAGTINLIRGATIELWVNGLKRATTTTTIDGRYTFNYTVGVGSYEFWTKFIGDDIHFPDTSPFLQGIYAKIETVLSIDVNPLFGAPPLAVTIQGSLRRDDTSLGLGGKTVDLYRDDVKIKSMVTKTTQPLGVYVFHDTLSAAGGHEYYVYFAGDTQFEGCEVGDGAVVSGEPPPDEEPPPEAGLGAGVLLLALLVLSQE